ncbi:MAG TPA: peptidylprolyl isomerase [Desulfobulbaceae bacterium]|nr:MAG: peptidylprolyl isomerase [Deltaproteobacteria bacterium RIFOXYD12_FULL_53_23]HCC53640.1 peptidylprolyl isomerase [Desulfobulbaceae bacterium]
MSQAKNGDSVKIHYTGTLEDGTVFDSSAGRDPLVFTVGGGQVIVGFEEAVLGMIVGDRKKVSISADKAYGEKNEDLVMEVSRDQVPPDLEPEVGQKLQMGGSNGELIVVTVVEVNEAVIILDANPPLAGKDLIFDLELVAIS